MLSISVFANAEKEDNLLNPLQKHITNTDSDDDMTNTQYIYTQQLCY